ncbi:MAG: hypothetical protein J5502_07670 [Prevotella sp.]|nr:hypothetical protein [Prevotella sp.]
MRWMSLESCHTDLYRSLWYFRSNLLMWSMYLLCYHKGPLKWYWYFHNNLCLIGLYQ